MFRPCRDQNPLNTAFPSRFVKVHDRREARRIIQDNWSDSDPESEEKLPGDQITCKWEREKKTQIPGFFRYPKQPSQKGIVIAFLRQYDFSSESTLIVSDIISDSIVFQLSFTPLAVNKISKPKLFLKNVAGDAENKKNLRGIDRETAENDRFVDRANLGKMLDPTFFQFYKEKCDILHGS